jgi:carboxylesterase
MAFQLPPDPGFFLPGPDRADACLLVHGSAGTAGDMRLLGEYLHRRGYTVLGVALPGHGVQPAELAGVSWKGCYATVREAWQGLCAEYRRVHVIGFSFGGTLTLHLAAHEPVDSAVLLAPALFVHFRPEGVVTFFAGLIPGTRARARVRWYVGLYGFLRVVVGNLPRIECPLLAIHAADDPLVQVKSSHAVCRRVSGREHRLKVLPRGGHLLPHGDAREEVWETVGDYLEGRRAGAEPAGRAAASS